jgi:hypothetical protein
VEFGNCAIVTTGASKIVGNTTGYIDTETDEYIFGDRIVFRSVLLDIGTDTQITADSTERWDGLWFENNETIDGITLRGTINSIIDIQISNSYVDFESAQISNIYQLVSTNNSHISFADSTKYIFNYRGME